MSVFISYSTKDKEFVDKLSLALLSKNIPVWRDIWQIDVGEYIDNSIKEAIQKSYYICLVISKNSLNSEWVQKEIEIALSRQSKENIENFIIPIIIDDCELPDVLKTIKGVNFAQKSFEEGIKEILNKIGKKYNIFAGKFTNEKIATYFGTDVEIFKDKIKFNIDVISKDENYDYFILTKIIFEGNDKVLEQFKIYENDNEGHIFLKDIIKVMLKVPDIANSKIVIENYDAKRIAFAVGEENGLKFKILITSKKIGIDNGNSVVLSLGDIFKFYVEEN